MIWTNIDPNQYKTVLSPPTWTESALNCHESNKNCSECIIQKATGRSWYKHTKEQDEAFTGKPSPSCKMPLTVQKLLDLGIPVNQKTFYANTKEVKKIKC